MRWISSRKRTSPSWREERIAARSPACWMAGPRGDADRGAHLGRDDHREGGLAEAGGAGEQHVVGGGAARAGGAQDQVELLADLLLADELVQVLGAQRGLDGLVLAVGGGADQPLVGGASVVGRCRPSSSAVSPRGRRRWRSAVRVAAPGRAARGRGPVSGRGSGSAGRPAAAGRPAGVALGGLGLRGDGGDRLVGLAGGVAEADQGGVQLVAPAGGDRRRRRPGRRRRAGSPSRSLSSSSSFWAPFLPMPGTAVSAFSSPVDDGAAQGVRACARRASPGRAGGRRRWRSAAARRPGARRRRRSRRGSASPRGRRGRWRAWPAGRCRSAGQGVRACTGRPCRCRRPRRTAVSGARAATGPLTKAIMRYGLSRRCGRARCAAGRAAGRAGRATACWSRSGRGRARCGRWRGRGRRRRRPAWAGRRAAAAG